PSVKTQDVTPNPRKRSVRSLTLSALSAGILLIAILIMAWSWGSRTEETSSPPATAIVPARETKVQTPTPPSAEPIARPQPTRDPAQPSRSKTDAVSARPAAPTRSVAMPTVVTAQLCTALRVWRCEAANSQVPPGPMFFYTQVKSATATTIEHRWYQG